MSRHKASAFEGVRSGHFSSAHWGMRIIEVIASVIGNRPVLKKIPQYLRPKLPIFRKY